MKTFRSILLFSIIVLAVNACKKDPEPEPEPQPNNPVAGMIKLGETNLTGAGAKAVAYSKDSLVTGYNTIYVQLVDSASGSILKDGHLTVNPVMDMGTKTHSCPVENDNNTSPSNGLYNVAVVFSMPGSASQWSLNFQYHNHTLNKEGKGSIGVKIGSVTPSRMINTIIAADDSNRVLISLVNPRAPKIGINDFELTIHKKQDMMNFPAISEYTVEIEPVMPSMGHGSPNNVNPVHTGNGHYRGKVNFTMSGLWQVKLKLFKNGVMLRDDLYFEINF